MQTCFWPVEQLKANLSILQRVIFSFCFFQQKKLQITSQIKYQKRKWHLAKSQTRGNFNSTLWESKSYLTAQFSSKTITIYTVDFFLPLYHRAVQCICSQRQTEEKIDTSYLVCIFFFVVCYLNTKLCHPLLIFIFRMELCLQRCHCMTTDLCSSFETDMFQPLPPWPRPAQAHKCLRNTRLSAGASVKNGPFYPLNKTRL